MMHRVVAKGWCLDAAALNRHTLRTGLRVPIKRAICLSSQHPAAASTAISDAAVGEGSASGQLLQWQLESDIFYSNYPLNRAHDCRKDRAWVQQSFLSPVARVTPVRGSKVLLTGTSPPGPANGIGVPPEGLQPVWLDPANLDLPSFLDPAVEPLFLGLDPKNHAPHFAVQVTQDGEKALSDVPGYTWLAARTAGPSLTPGDAALMAVASGLAIWNLNNQYHGASGSKTAAADGGFSRRCQEPERSRSLYPRVDPAIITLVTAGQWCLLGRKEGWPVGRYSTLAGFLELGETLEQCLAREVLEESGVAVDLSSIRYNASQPWPFPQSLMVAFYASTPMGSSSSSSSSISSSARSGAEEAMGLLSPEGRRAVLDLGIKLEEVAAVLLPRLPTPVPQPGEMQDVRWFHRDWLQWAVSNEGSAPGSFVIPGHYSLANRLIRGWLRQPLEQQQQQQPMQPPTPEQQQHHHQEQGARELAALGFGTTAYGWEGDQVPQVQVDEGVFKYVLMRLYEEGGSRSKLLVWGATAAAYHNHIYQQAKVMVNRVGLSGRLRVDVLGGGRMEHYPEQGFLSVYGYSAAFGPAPHELTAAILKRWYPLYPADGITISYEGY